MVLDRIRRRKFLGGVTATMTGIAGCGGKTTEQTSPKSTRASTQSNLDSTKEQPIPEHDHSGSSAGGAILNPDTASVSQHQQAQSYTVYKRDGKVRALNGETEREEFSGGAVSTILQQVIDEVGGENGPGGTIFLRSGVYRTDANEIALQSNVHLVGEGPGATILKLKDGVNGTRGQKRATVLNVRENVHDVTIRDLEIDGNESNNRGVPPYPMSPHHHGIMIHGSSPKVPESRKPANILVKNVYVHDTVRSNIVLAGRNCRLENLTLENSATDHWLYMGGATNCVVDGIHASGFARTEGIVLGTEGRRCSGNTVSNVKISRIEETPYQNDEPKGFKGRYPIMSFSLRPGEGDLRYDNTIQNVDVSLPDAKAGQTFVIGHPNTQLENVNYRGPNGQWGVVSLLPKATGTRVENASLQVAGTGRTQGGPIVQVNPSNAALDGVTINDAQSKGMSGIVVVPSESAIHHMTVRDTTINTADSALVFNGSHNSMQNLVVDNVFDEGGSGIKTVGDVQFAQRNVY